jgi:hypothetical protein
MLCHDGHRFVWDMGGSGIGATGFGRIGGNNVGKHPASVSGELGLENNRAYDCLVRVKRNGLDAFLDGKLLVHYPTDYADVGPHPEWDLEGDQIGVGCIGRTIFHRIELAEPANSDPR